MRNIIKLSILNLQTKEREWFVKHDKIVFGKILVFEEMLKDNGKISIGRPEMIVYKEYGKCISVRLDKKNRYVYEFKLLNENTFLVVSCKGHHGDH